jgi:hypothetical protein
MHFKKNVISALFAILLLFAAESFICGAVLPETLPAKLAARCLQYEPATVNLNGQIMKGAFVNASGKKETVWLLKLDTPICVDSDGADSINQKAENIKRLQLVLTPNDYKSYQKYLTKKVSASGALFYGHTQHHFTEVLLSVTAIRLKS